jgi:hypothetical protein
MTAAGHIVRFWWTRKVFGVVCLCFGGIEFEFRALSCFFFFFLLYFKIGSCAFCLGWPWTALSLLPSYLVLKLEF